MRKIKEIIKQHVINNKKEYVIVTLLFIIGIFFGVLFVNNVNESQKTEVTEYLGNFIEKIKNVDKLDNMDLLKTSMNQNIFLAIFLWFFGTTVIGIPIVFGMIAYKGFCFGYTIAVCVSSLGLQKGIIFILVNFLASSIFIIPAILGLGVSGFKLYKSIIKDNRKENIKLEKDKIYTFSVYLKSDSEKELMIGFNGEEEKIKVNESFNRFTKTFKAEDKNYDEFLFKIEGDISKDSYLEIYDLSISEGEENTKEEEINYNEKIETKEVPLREGYTFTGWYKDLSLKEKVNDSVKEDAIYYAKWIPNTYTLKLDVNGKVTEVKGSFNSLKKLEIPESNYKITYDEREVFIKRSFKGWVNENNETAIENYIFKKDEKLKAIFEDTVNVQLEDINKENNICSWNTKKSGNGESYDAKTTININSDIKLYSICNEIIKIKRPLNSGTITSNYGNRIHPVSNENKFHSGIDMSSSDKNIYPVLPGVIAKTGSNSSMGNYIIIHHTYNNQNYTSAYYHLEEKYVRKNQKVDQNTVIGKMGQTGIATGVHLHLTMYKGHLDSENSEMIDPKSVIDLPSNWNSRVY